MPCGCCLLAVAGSIVPRLTVVFLWIFTDLVQDAFDGWIVPLLGTIFLPFTTLTYLVVYWIAEGNVAWGWMFVFIAFFFDLGSYASGGWRGRDVAVPRVGG